MISVDTKKREQLGQLPMARREWWPKGDPVRVEDRHVFFTGPDVKQIVPYGIYDMTRPTRWVNVGVDHSSRLSTAPADSKRRARQEPHWIGNQAGRGHQARQSVLPLPKQQ